MHVRRFNQQSAAIRHRITRVDRKVEQRVLKLRWVDACRPQIGGQTGVNLDTFSYCPLQDRDHVGQVVVQVEDLCAQGLLARESKQALGQLGPPHSASKL